MNRYVPCIEPTPPTQPGQVAGTQQNIGAAGVQSSQATGLVFRGRVAARARPEGGVVALRQMAAGDDVNGSWSYPQDFDAVSDSIGISAILLRNDFAGFPDCLDPETAQASVSLVSFNGTLPGMASAWALGYEHVLSDRVTVRNPPSGGVPYMLFVPIADNEIVALADTTATIQTDPTRLVPWIRHENPPGLDLGRSGRPAILRAAEVAYSDLPAFSLTMDAVSAYRAPWLSEQVGRVLEISRTRNDTGFLHLEPNQTHVLGLADGQDNIDITFRIVSLLGRPEDFFGGTGHLFVAAIDLGYPYRPETSAEYTERWTRSFGDRTIERGAEGSQFTLRLRLRSAPLLKSSLFLVWVEYWSTFATEASRDRRTRLEIVSVERV